MKKIKCCEYIPNPWTANKRKYPISGCPLLSTVGTSPILLDKYPSYNPNSVNLVNLCYHFRVNSGNYFSSAIYWSCLAKSTSAITGGPVYFACRSNSACGI
jgi:hypothetical protein